MKPIYEAKTIRENWSRSICSPFYLWTSHYVRCVLWTLCYVRYVLLPQAIFICKPSLSVTCNPNLPSKCTYHILMCLFLTAIFNSINSSTEKQTICLKEELTKGHTSALFEMLDAHYILLVVMYIRTYVSVNTHINV